MTQGNEAEHAMIARLHEVGPFCRPRFAIAEQQHRFEVKDRDGIVLVTGKMDGRVKFEDGQHPPIEIKSGRSYENAETVEDLDRNVWARTSVDQLLAYLYADDPKHYPNREPWGFILVRRQSDLPAMIRINLLEHLARVEAFMQEARKAVDARHARADLPPFTTDPGECRRCAHFGKSCTPPLDYGDGVQIVTDPALIEAAVIRDRNRAARDEYEHADRMLKESLRGVESALLGDYHVTGKWSPLTTYEFPKELKAQYAKVNPQGRFTLSIARIQS
jgi:CRISPR/Cas system-associated exonuclease Cas4 (RecB family)